LGQSVFLWRFLPPGLEQEAHSDAADGETSLCGFFLKRFPGGCPNFSSLWSKLQFRLIEAGRIVAQGLIIVRDKTQSADRNTHPAVLLFISRLNFPAGCAAYTLSIDAVSSFERGKLTRNLKKTKKKIYANEWIDPAPPKLE